MPQPVLMEPSRVGVAGDELVDREALDHGLATDALPLAVEEDILILIFETAKWDCGSWPFWKDGGIRWECHQRNLYRDRLPGSNTVARILLNDEEFHSMIPNRDGVIVAVS
ncbi:MAG: hypothetical protein ACKV0T_31425 [Planctomycetales bacterium]